MECSTEESVDRDCCLTLPLPGALSQAGPIVDLSLPLAALLQPLIRQSLVSQPALHPRSQLSLLRDPGHLLQAIRTLSRHLLPQKQQQQPKKAQLKKLQLPQKQQQLRKLQPKRLQLLHLLRN